MLMSKFVKPFIALSFDAFIAGASLWVAIILRYDFNLPPLSQNLFVTYTLVYMVVCTLFYVGFNLHKNIWRYTTARDLIRLCYATIFSIMSCAAILTILKDLTHIPRSVFIILPLLQIALLSFPRVVLRLWHDKVFQTALKLKSNRENILIIGVNDAADLFVRECCRKKEIQYHIVGAVDDDLSKKGRLFHGIPVFDSVENLSKVLIDLDKKRFPVKTLIIAEARGEKLRKIVDIATARNIQLKRIPTISNLKDGNKLSDLKPVMIEDLLGRTPVTLDNSSIVNSLKDQVVLVTGAGGSIGRELCRQIIKNKPKHLLLLDHSEDALYHVGMEFYKDYPKIKCSSLLIDIKNKEDIVNALKEYKPSIVFHAAAYKHVPMIEDNPIAGIENNLLGTAILADASIEAKIPKMIMISTDKAVNPTNVMGATKRAAEMYALNTSQNTKTNIMAVRFGNVLGSNGSVIPLFKKQILAGGPLTVTHKDATRYFMTIPEAAGLVLQAAAKGINGNLFMLDMGESVKIIHLAEQMIRLSGLTPYEDIDIEVVGLRPGEKLFEELWYGAEGMSKTDMEKTFLVNPQTLSKTQTNEKISAIKKACVQKNAFLAVQTLKELVKEYQPSKNSPYAALKDKEA